MTRGATSVTFEAALQDPQAFFAEPQDVADYPELSREQKLEILRRWEQDALRLSASESEGMGGGEENMIGRVELALRKVREQSG
jgi:hypothetical protein